MDADDAMRKIRIVETVLDTTIVHELCFSMNQSSFALSHGCDQDKILRQSLTIGDLSTDTGNFSIGGEIHFVHERALYKISGCSRIELYHDIKFREIWCRLLAIELATGNPNYLQLWMLMSI